jgi:hypothetical protein
MPADRWPTGLFRAQRYKLSHRWCPRIAGCPPAQRRTIEPRPVVAQALSSSRSILCPIPLRRADADALIDMRSLCGWCSRKK